MKFHFKKTALISAALAAALLMTLSVNITAASAKVSPALDILANDLNLVKTGLVNNDITFTAADFDRALGFSKTESITVLSLPPISDGKLMLGSLEIMKNQTVSRSNMNLMRFVPAKAHSGSLESSFKFSGKSSSQDYSAICTLYVLNELNFAPTASTVNESFLKVTTLKNITVYGAMKAVDPENDKLTYEIVTQPRKGVIEVLDRSYGEYRYTPVSNFTGKDSFEYVVRDKYGNYSDNIKVNITVEKLKTDVVYSDMTGHWAYNAAIRMTAANIMSGEKRGNTMVFNPTGAVTRCEFLVMAMKAIGHDVNVSTVNTGFADDADIPSQYKGYVAAALQLGYISGFTTDKGAAAFHPNNQITRAEAAVMLNNMLDTKQPVIRSAFADETTVPAWAENAIYALNELGILKGTGDGYMSPYAVISRAQAAQMLYTVMNMLKD